MPFQFQFILLSNNKIISLESSRRSQGANYNKSVANCDIMHGDDDVYYYICKRLKLEGQTKNMGVCTKERKGGTASDDAP